MSADTDLTGRIVLIVEDEAFIALDIEMMVEDFGGQVLGPFGHLDQALEAIENGGFDVALLDIMLGRDEVFPAAKLLQEKSLPFAFHSGHGIPLSSGSEYRNVPMLHKPCRPEQLATALSKLCNGHETQ